ncbi:hypothetical protein BDW68DRAFT_155136 [Aspergillus falconensis]
MQLYLPGHKPGPNTCTSIVKSINSSLRESMFRLASRYAQLYVFIAHNPDQSTHSKSRISNPQLTVDRRLSTSLTSITAFCTSISEYSRIIPLLIPSVPESISTWILTLAHKHICQLPPLLTAGSQLQYRIAFTPVNPKPQLGGLLGEAQESVWGWFLRRTGLNPYAAQAVLAVLRREYGEGPNFSRFVEMSVGERRAIWKSTRRQGYEGG